jgi:hypothetical protein
MALGVQAFNQRTFEKNLVITPEELKAIFLYGIDMTNDNGDPFPDEMFEFYIRSAQEWLEAEIGGICLSDTLIQNETHDYFFTDYQSFNFMKLFRYPVLSVEKVSVNFPLGSSREFDPSWFRCESVGAQLQLVPKAGGTFADILVGAGNPAIGLFGGQLHFPSAWNITYRAGFAKDKIPTTLKEIVGMKASMGPLNIAGDLIAGAGIASKSISMDGVSQSISTTSSATNAGYGARILQYDKEIKSRMHNLKNYFVGIQMVVT